MSRYGADRRDPIVAISLVPLVGVVIALACLFLASGGTSARTLPLATPTPRCTEGMPPPRLLALDIDANGEAWENDEHLTAAALQARLVELARWPVRRLVLAPHRDTTHDRVVDIVAMANRARIAEISIAGPRRAVAAAPAER